MHALSAEWAHCLDLPPFRGGFKLDAPAPRGQVSGVSSAGSQSAQFNQVVGTCPRVEVDMHGVTVKCLMDTGSQVTLIPESLYRSLPNSKNGTVKNTSWLALRAVNGLEQWFSKWGARPPGGARTLSRGGAMSQTEKEKKTADLSLVSESSLSSEMQGAGLTLSLIHTPSPRDRG